jgi:tRNA pseudouridine55 synthase
MTEGLLLVDKPVGWTSFDVVNYIRKMIATAEGKKPKTVKVGHTGTLDPAATGLLVLTVGTYCKRAGEFSKLDKTYEVTARLGMHSSTGDAEGELSPVSTEVPQPLGVKNTLLSFVGEQLQTPPVFSALKINGKRAYELARAGQTVKLEPRPVTVYTIENLRYRYPEVHFTARVSSGTYIRSLVADFGDKLGTGAYMSALRRVSVGRFWLEEALEPTEFDFQKLTQRLITY